MNSALNLKKELLKLIEVEKDTSILKAIHTLLQKASTNQVLKEKLISRVLKSEKDIKEGRIFTREEAEGR